MSGAAPTVRTRTSQRIASFDGTRGMMAVIMVLWHTFLIVSPAMLVWVSTHPNTAGAWWWDLVDPTHFLTRTIVVYFILSGIVLTMQTSRAGFSWWAYYPSRLLRLYLPAWASLVFGLVLIALFPRGYAPSNTWLGYTNPTHVGIGQLLWQATLMSQEPSGINNPLWSITWEVLFSVSLPLFAVFAWRTTNGWLWVIGAAVAVTAIGDELQMLALMYMPTFLIGSVAAANIEKLHALADSINSSRWHTLWWWLIFVVSFASISGYRITASMQLVKPFTLINHVLSSTTVIGYMGFVFIAMGCRSAKRFLVTKPLLWLGVVSFSLYLVHVPILATLAFSLGSKGVWWVPVIGVPLSILAAFLFSRFIERPSHRFAKAVGRLVAERAALRSERPLVAAEHSDRSGR